MSQTRCPSKKSSKGVKGTSWGLLFMQQRIIEMALEGIAEKGQEVKIEK